MTRRRLWTAAVLLLALPAWGAEAAPASHDAGPALEKLAASVDRLVGLLERELAFRTDERDARRVEVALGILELRYRKIDRIESEIQQINHDEDETAGQIELMKTRLEQLAKQAQAAGKELPQETKQDIAVMEVRSKSREEHLALMRERRNVLQNDLAAERRRLASVEATLDAWMDKR